MEHIILVIHIIDIFLLNIQITAIIIGDNLLFGIWGLAVLVIQAFAFISAILLNILLVQKPLPRKCRTCP